MHHLQSKPAVTNIGSMFAGVLGKVEVRVTPTETIHYPDGWKSKDNAERHARRKQSTQEQASKKPAAEKTAVQKKVVVAEPAKKVAVKSQPKPASKKQVAKKTAVQPATNVSSLPFILSGNDVEVMSHKAMQAEFARNEITAEQAATSRTTIPHANSYPPSKLASKKTEAKKAVANVAKAVEKVGKKTPVFPSHLVPVPSGREYAIIFECSKKLILASGDLQIGSSTGGAKALPKETGQDAVSRAQLQSVRADMVTFDRHCTISGINILAIPGSSLCRVFVNFKSAIDDSGKHWGEGTDYEKFLARTLFGRKWNKVGIKDEAGKTSITLKNPDPDQKGAAAILLAFRE